MKKKSLAKVKKELWVVFSRYIRLRDCLATTGSPEYGECISCFNNFEFKELQAGHFIPGREGGNLFSERGVHAQCRRCNIFMGGMQLEYRRQIIKLYGEGVDLELEEEAKEIRKYIIPELEEMKGHYLKEIDKLGG